MSFMFMLYSCIESSELLHPFALKSPDMYYSIQAFKFPCSYYSTVALILPVLLLTWVCWRQHCRSLWHICSCWWCGTRSHQLWHVSSTGDQGAECCSHCHLQYTTVWWAIVEYILHLLIQDINKKWNININFKGQFRT